MLILNLKPAEVESMAVQEELTFCKEQIALVEQKLKLLNKDATALVVEEKEAVATRMVDEDVDLSDVQDTKDVRFYYMNLLENYNERILLTNRKDHALSDKQKMVLEANLQILRDKDITKDSVIAEPSREVEIEPILTREIINEVNQESVFDGSVIGEITWLPQNLRMRW